MGDRYKYVGNKVPGDGTTRLIIKGDSTNPEKFLDLNGETEELTETEYNRLSDRYELRKTSSSSGSSSGSGSSSSSASGSSSSGSQSN